MLPIKLLQIKVNFFNQLFDSFLIFNILLYIIDTIWRIGSVTKLFPVIMMYQLRDKGFKINNIFINSLSKKK